MGRITIEDLQRIKEREQARMTMRSGQYRAKIIVHMGTCGIASGARKILSTFLEEIEKAGITDVMVTQTGCAGLCSREPMVTVEIQGQAPVKYVDLDEERARTIFEEHVQRGRIIEEWAMGRGSETVAG